MSRAFALSRISASAFFVASGLRPRSMSFAPSSTMSASVASGTDQSKRARPSAAVSPETPAFATATS